MPNLFILAGGNTPSPFAVNPNKFLFNNTVPLILDKQKVQGFDISEQEKAIRAEALFLDKTNKLNPQLIMLVDLNTLIARNPN